MNNHSSRAVKVSGRCYVGVSARALIMSLELYAALAKAIGLPVPDFETGPHPGCSVCQGRSEAELREEVVREFDEPGKLFPPAGRTGRQWFQGQFERRARVCGRVRVQRKSHQLG